MSATVYPTQDGNFIATCQITGKGASGRTRQHALSNLLSSEKTTGRVDDLGTVQDALKMSTNGPRAIGVIESPSASSWVNEWCGCNTADSRERPAQVSASFASNASQAADEKAVPPFNKRGTASSHGQD